MNYISHNCVSGRIYQQKGIKNGNPFVWCMIMPDDFLYLYNNYYSINFHNVKLERDGECRKIVIDDKIKVLYPHYKYNKDCDTPEKKTEVDIFYNKIDDLVLEKYKERLSRMSGDPLFIVTDREFQERPEYNFKKEDLIKYIGKENSIVVVYDKSIIGENVIHLSEKNMDPNDIALVILKTLKK